MPPEKAAIAVVRKYAIGVSGSNYSAREIGAKQERVWAWPRRVTYVVSLEGHACAQIRLKDIVGLGWQEESYEALKTEPNQAPEPTPGTVTPRADARVAPVPVVARL